MKNTQIFDDGESNANSGIIAIRMFQYDVAVALENKTRENDRELIYTVPVVKSQEYTKDDIFEKRLYVLLPYYILRYEKQLAFIEQGYSELHKLMGRVLDYILQERSKTKKGVQQVMGGHVLESWKEEMIRICRTEILNEQQKKLEAKVLVKMKEGKSAEHISLELIEDLSVIQPLYDTLRNTL